MTVGNGIEVVVAELPEGVDKKGLGRLSLDGKHKLWRCEILRKRCTAEQRQIMKDDGFLTEFPHDEWLSKAASLKYTAPNDD